MAHSPPNDSDPKKSDAGAASDPASQVTIKKSKCACQRESNETLPLPGSGQYGHDRPQQSCSRPPLSKNARLHRVAPVAVCAPQINPWCKKQAPCFLQLGVVIHYDGSEPADHDPA